MEFKLIKLQLNCTDSVEKVELSKQITFIHGETATGKSSVARLVDFCLGADFEHTPALDKELVSAELYLKTAKYDFVIRREKNSKQVQVSWTNNEGVTESRLVPLVKTDVPVFEDIYNLSDLLLYLIGLPNVKVAVNIADEISPVRLSFRDIMWYCYLKQDLLDSCFFNLDENSESNRRRKSRFVFRYITRLYTESISELEVQLAILEDKRKKRTQEIANIRAFLSQFGYASEQQLQKDIDQARQELQNSKTELNKMQSGFKSDTHFADSLRDELINLTKLISEEEKAVSRIQRKIAEQESLRTESDCP
jgi:DNA repair exonuclease SbcCD ATPase subunit